MALHFGTWMIIRVEAEGPDFGACQALDFFDQTEASMEPERLCHREKTAPGRAAAAEKYLRARATASPEFCIPTSIAMVRQVLVSQPAALGMR